MAKGTNLKILKPEQVERAVNLMNNRPRQCLDYRTPNEVFYKGGSDSDAIQALISLSHQILDHLLRILELYQRAVTPDKLENL